MLKFITKLSDQIESATGIENYKILTLLFALLLAVFLFSFSFEVPDIIQALVAIGPFFLPVLLGYILFKLWMNYIQLKQRFSTPYILLEIKLPKEITQSPLAMETFVNFLYQTGEPGNFIEAYIQGKTRPHFSLEMASFEGTVKFFIWARALYRTTLEAQLYSQYPDVEVSEVPDYTEHIQYDPSTMDLVGVLQGLKKPDPYPIKTYVDFGLHEERKEEYKTDPISSILEFLGSLGKGEYAWMQIIVRSHVPEKKKPGTWFEKVDWQYTAQEEIKKILKTLEVKGGDKATFPRIPTKGEAELIASLERNISKKPFDTGIRIIYFAKKENYKGERLISIPTMFRNFESHTLNGFKPTFPTKTQAYPWVDRKGLTSAREKKELFDAYRFRSYFYPPYKYQHFVLSAEELATVYHFPGRVTQTPTLERISSKKGGAPANLPV